MSPAETRRAGPSTPSRVNGCSEPLRWMICYAGLSHGAEGGEPETNTPEGRLGTEAAGAAFAWISGRCRVPAAPAVGPWGESVTINSPLPGAQSGCLDRDSARHCVVAPPWGRGKAPPSRSSVSARGRRGSGGAETWCRQRSFLGSPLEAQEVGGL